MDTKRTDSQNKALHLWFELMATELQTQGIDMKNAMEAVKVYDAPVTKYGIKEYIWRPIMTSLYGKKSTIDLLKREEIDKIYDTICKAFGEMGVAIPPFPSAEIENFNQTYEDNNKNKVGQ